MSKDHHREYEKPYHENTKGEKHERKMPIVEKTEEGYVINYPLLVTQENPKNLMPRVTASRTSPNSESQITINLLLALSSIKHPAFSIFLALTLRIEARTTSSCTRRHRV